jgi:hypothetical protein
MLLFEPLFELLKGLSVRFKLTSLGCPFYPNIVVDK